jgi:hypothetical protein
MAYFNGSLHGYNSPTGFIPPVKVTRIYCDDCAVVMIPLDSTAKRGQEHFETDFRWAPVFGEPCHKCGKEC